MDDKLGQFQVGLPVFCLVFVFFLEGKLPPASVTAALLLQEVVLAARGCDASGLMYRGDASFNKKADPTTPHRSPSFSPEFFDAIANGILFLISFLGCSLPLYRSTIKILYINLVFCHHVELTYSNDF